MTPAAEVCINPTIRGLLAAHVVELLEDSAAEVEDHLLDCLHCRDMYLKMHSVLSTAPAPRPARSAEDASALKKGAKVVSIADFKRCQQ